MWAAEKCLRQMLQKAKSCKLRTVSLQVLQASRRWTDRSTDLLEMSEKDSKPSAAITAKHFSPCHRISDVRTSLSTSSREGCASVLSDVD